MGLGVPAGARTPNHDDASNPGSPDSASVGTSGSAAERSALVTASARNLPALMNESDDGRLSNINCTCPPIRSVSAGLLPLYGTCVISTPVIVLNSSPDRWIDVPLPDDAKLSLPGFAFAYAISSCTDLNGNDGLTTSTFGTPATRITGAKSLTWSYGIFLYRL